jgi:alanyl-tRNA synthetase
LLAEITDLRKELTTLRQNLVAAEFNSVLDQTQPAGGIDVLTATIADADPDTLRQMLDRFRERHPTNGIAVLASVQDGRPVVLAAITDDLVKRGLHAGELVREVAQTLGGGGGGRPNLAQAGGKDASKLGEALAGVVPWVEKRVQTS